MAAAHNKTSIGHVDVSNCDIFYFYSSLVTTVCSYAIINSEYARIVHKLVSFKETMSNLMLGYIKNDKAMQHDIKIMS